jgi:AraC-like DNA-binding protein
MSTRPRNKPGPAPMVPTTDDRRRVEVGIGGGLSVAALARLFDMSRRTFNRVFASEIETGRTRVTVEMALCLYKAASDGKNVAAAKALLGFVERAAKPDSNATPESRWSGLAERVHRGDSISDILPENKILKLDS